MKKKAQTRIAVKRQRTVSAAFYLFSANFYSLFVFCTCVCFLNCAILRLTDKNKRK